MLCPSRYCVAVRVLVPMCVKAFMHRADFVSKMSIALKESGETEYWLELLHEAEYIDDKAYESISNDNSKISATLINIIKKAKELKE